MPANPDIAVVCFDLGGVVLRICRSWEEGCAAAGVTLRGEDPMGRADDDWLAILSDHQTGRITFDRFVERFATWLDGVYTPEEIVRVHNAWILGEYDDIREVVEHVHASGRTSAVLSNTDAQHWMIAPGYPVMDRFQHVLASHEIGLRKPDPAAYRVVEERTGARGAQILFFDDLPENVAAARDVGWHAVEIDPLGDPATQVMETLRRYGL